MENQSLHKIQKISSYISGYGITVYETLQYNKNSKEWYIVGDSYTNLELITSIINHHNMIIELKNTIK